MPEHEVEKRAELFAAAEAPKVEEGYEKQELLGRKTLFWFATVHFGGLVATIILSMFLMRWFSKNIGPENTQLPPGSPSRVLPALPRLQADPHKDKETLHIKDEELQQYSIDAKGGAHIPIERAIEIVAAQNLPHREATEDKNGGH